MRSSTVISGDEDEDEEAGESYLTAGPDVDFVTAVAAAAHHSGLTVVGSTVTQPGTRHTSGKLFSFIRFVVNYVNTYYYCDIISLSL